MIVRKEAKFIGIQVTICPTYQSPIAQMVERPLREREVVGSIPGRAIFTAVKMLIFRTALSEAVLTNTHNLCFSAKIRK